MRPILLLTFFFTVISNSFAKENPFKTLPYNIVIGVTSNEEIESRGICQKQIEIKENYFRCEEYDMNGNFRVYSSQNEKVRQILIQRRYTDYPDEVDLHRVPRAWREAGFSWQISADDFMTWAKQFDDIKYLELIPVFKKLSNGETYLQKKRVTFEVDNHFFDLYFRLEEDKDDENLLGNYLLYMTITEAY